MGQKIISFDYALKYLLRDKGSYHIIEAFISALLKSQGYGPIKIIALLDTESNREEISQKKSLADLIVEDEQGQKYIIEIERQQVTNYAHKACFKTSRLIADQLPSGTDFLSLKKVFHISLLYFKVGRGSLFHGKTIVREVETGEKLSFHIEDAKHGVIDVTNIFPEYIFIAIPDFDDDIQEELDEWLYVLKHAEVREDFKSDIMRRVADKLNVLHMTKEERDGWINYNKSIETFKDATALQYDLGKKEGKTEGKIEGIIEGKKDIVREMLKMRIDLETISKATKLSLSEIKSLAESEEVG
jgi:predicted transposase/invertase (TIGR01784 family)